jgi:lipopolysaccharide transport system ATP-binding protein
MEIVSVRLLGLGDLAVTALNSGDPLRVEIEYQAPMPISNPIFGVTISREDGFICYDTSTAATGISLPTVQGPGCIAFQMERLDLIGGQYYVDVGVYESDWAYAYDYHWHVYPLLVHATGNEKGVLRPPHRWELTDVPVHYADALASR